MPSWPRRLHVTAIGHPAVRATHGKTFELTADPTLGERGTCILGVAADLDGLDEEPVLAGLVMVTVTAGDVADTVVAIANPLAVPARRVVVRRSDVADADTIAGLADRGAADLDRDLLEALRDQSTRVVLDMVEAGQHPVDNALLALVPPGAAPLPGTETVTDLATVADRLIEGDHLALDVPPAGLDRRAAEAVSVAHDLGAVVVVVPGPWHVPPVLLAAGIATPNHLDAGTLTGTARREIAVLAGAATAGVPVAARAEPGDLPAVLARMAEHLGAATPAAVTPDPLTPYRAVVRGPLGDLEPPTDTAPARSHLVAVAAPDGTAQTLPPPVEQLVATLAADNLPVRRLAVAVAAATGWSRQRSYDAVLALRARRRAERT